MKHVENYRDPAELNLDSGRANSPPVFDDFGLIRALLRPVTVLSAVAVLGAVLWVVL